MGNFSLNGDIPRLSDTHGFISFIRKRDVQTVSQFFPDCPSFKTSFESICPNLNLKIHDGNLDDGMQITDFYVQFRSSTEGLTASI